MITLSRPKLQKLFVHDFVALSARLLLYVNTSPNPNNRSVLLINILNSMSVCLYCRPTYTKEFVYY